MISRRAKRATIGFIVLALVIASLTMAVARYFQNREERRRYEEEQAKVEPLPVVDYTVRRQTKVRKREYPAELLPWTDAAVPAEVTGRVVETYVEAGQEVQEGEPLVRLDSAQAEFRLREAEARLDERMRLVEEAKVLLQKRVASKTEYEALASEVREVRAQCDALRDDLARHLIRAPFTGVVNRRMVDVGEAVRVNDPVARLVDLDRLRVEFYVSEFDLSSFEVGESLDLIVPTQPDKVFKPQVDFMARVAADDTRLFRIEAILPNEDTKLPGGIQGEVTAEVGSFNALFVPAAAVRFEGADAQVLRINGEKETGLVTVRLGPEIDGYYPVYDGLNAGDRILIR